MQQHQVSELAELAHVSILTRSEERVQHEEDGEIEEAFEVSILTRSEERVQPYKVSPAWQAADSFNPHPLRGAGATVSAAPQYRKRFVSILTRSEERVQRVEAQAGELDDECFNPHPLRGAGATSWSAELGTSMHSFQSSPAPRSGCNPGRAALQARV